MKTHRLLLAAVFLVPLLAGAQIRQSTTAMRLVGTASPGGVNVSSVEESGYERRTDPSLDPRLINSVSGSLAPARVPADHVPMPPDNKLTYVNPGFFGFDGLTHRDQRLAGTGVYQNSQTNGEPPDQGLAVGDGFVVEMINNALAIYDTSGRLLSGPTALSQFFGVAPEFIRPSGPNGPFLSDPKVYFDFSLDRWFLTHVIVDLDPVSGAFTGTTGVLIGVSQTADPTGSWTIFRLDTTDATGTPDHFGCPCLGDQPLIGADANGFYISTNEGALFRFAFNGAQIYAISKVGLVNAAASAGNLPAVIQFSNLNFLPGLPFFSVQPATTPPGGIFESANGGTEYFLSALDFSGTLTNQIAVWALTNTSSLATRHPNLTLTVKAIDSEIYGSPPYAQQKDGPIPLATIYIPQIFGGPRQKLELVISDGDTINSEVVFANGKLWAAVNTVVKTPNGPARVGIAYFIITPSDIRGNLSAAVASQGYVSVNQNDVMYPSIAVNNSGRGVMAFTLVGGDFFPTAAYAPIDAVNGAGDVHVGSAGTAPVDGFAGYVFFNGGCAFFSCSGSSLRSADRWGDYSAAVTAPDGSLWMAVEYIPNEPRTILANWGTFISNVMP